MPHLTVKDLQGRPLVPKGHDSQLPRDDLRAYAYEGEGASSGSSWASTISGTEMIYI